MIGDWSQDQSAAADRFTRCLHADQASLTWLLLIHVVLPHTPSVLSEPRRKQGGKILSSRWALLFALPWLSEGFAEVVLWFLVRRHFLDSRNLSACKMFGSSRFLAESSSSISAQILISRAIRSWRTTPLLWNHWAWIVESWCWCRRVFDLFLDIFRTCCSRDGGYIGPHTMPRWGF